MGARQGLTAAGSSAVDLQFSISSLLGRFLIYELYLFAILFPPGDKSRSRCSSNLAKKVAMI